jgi:Flp pilus assembly protein TadD
MMPRLPQPEHLPQRSETSAPASSSVPSSKPTQSSNPVVVSLLDSATQFESQGNFGRASASVERGLRIAPKDAHLWLRLARIRLQEDRPKQAELLAKKSIRFSARNAGLLADNWLVIAEARGRQGNLNGVVEAKEKAAQHQKF